MYGMIASITAVPGRRDELIALLVGAVSGMPGCLSYVVQKDAQQNDKIWITEVWDTKASHEASLLLPQVKDAITKARPLIAGFERSAETEPVGGVGLRQQTAG